MAAAGPRRSPAKPRGAALRSRRPSGPGQRASEGPGRCLALLFPARPAVPLLLLLLDICACNRGYLYIRPTKKSRNCRFKGGEIRRFVVGPSVVTPLLHAHVSCCQDHRAGLVALIDYTSQEAKQEARGGAGHRRPTRTAQPEPRPQRTGGPAATNGPLPSARRWGPEHSPHSPRCGNVQQSRMCGWDDERGVSGQSNDAG